MLKIPALLTNTSSEPNRDTASATAAIPVLLPAHVQVEVDGVVADVLGYRLAQVVEDVAEDDLRPFLDEQPHLGLPLAPCPAGNQRHLASQSVHRSFFSP